MRTHRANKTERITLRLTKELKDDLVRAAKEAGVSQNGFICVAIYRLTTKDDLGEDAHAANERLERFQQKMRDLLEMGETK